MDQMDRWERRQQRREQWRQRRMNRRPHSPVFPGIILIAIGALFLLSNLNIVFLPDIWQYWPVILIVVGGYKMVTSQCTSQAIGGLILVCIGGVFLLRSLGYIHGNVWAFVWPMILIAIGASMIAKRMEWQDRADAPPVTPSANAFSGPGSSETSFSANISNRLNIHLAFSSLERRIESKEFEGGDIKVSFGSVELDLRGAVPKYDQIRIDAHAVFGSIEIWIPDTWESVVEGKAAFGAFEDHTHTRAAFGEKRPRLIVTGGAAFGGVEIKS